MCKALRCPVPPTPWFSALIGFAAYLSHLHLKTCAPPTSNKAKLGDSVGLYVTVKVAIISRKEQERRLELIHALLYNTFCENGKVLKSWESAVYRIQTFHLGRAPIHPILIQGGTKS